MKEYREHVCLVGAGPGAADLISVRGLERLRQAEVLLYDRLSGEALLDEVPEACEKINVGKASGAHAMRQEEINELLVEKARTGKYVVRLKGGDPFVFGRGGEEALALEEAGISYELVPGISSCIAAPELAGIPVTHRETARSFHVITGHTAKACQDYTQYAKLSGTLIFLMGVGSLKQIAGGLLSGGMEADTPVSIIENGALAAQRRIDGTLADITDIAMREQVHAPAVIVVGTCAAFHMLRQTEEYAVRKCRIGVTGSAHMASKICGLLNAEGISCESFVTTKIAGTNALAQELVWWEAVDWMVFTSSNAVEQFFSQLSGLCIDRRRLAGVKYAVIGRGTAAKLSEYGLYADFIPAQADAGTLGRELAQKLSAGTVAVFQPECADDALRTALSSNPSLDVRTYPIYRLYADEEQVGRFWDAFPQLDYVICTSAGSVRFLKRPISCKHMPVFLCLGAKTEAALNSWLASTEAAVLRAEDNSAEGLAVLLRGIL